MPGFSVEAVETHTFGDYATNAAMLLARELKKSPMEIAEQLAQAIRQEGGGQFNIEAANPGFVNFTLSESTLKKGLEEILSNQEAWGTSAEGNGKTAVVEYFQLNIAKRPHVGHLRSAVIGDALKRILLSQGYHAISDTHVGDWGTQFGMLLLGFKTEGMRLEDVQKLGDPFGELEKVYTEANARIEKEPSLRDKAKLEFAKLEQGDKQNRELWEWMVRVSMEKLEESAQRLGLLPFDEHKGESAYENEMPGIVEDALAKRVAVKKEDGAVTVDLTSENLDEAILIKSDSASTYLLRDLATITYRKEHWNFWRNLYVVDVRQAHHFRQVFRVAELLGYEGIGDSKHVEFGFLKLPEGPMSTRAGNVISLDAVMDEAFTRARAVIKEKNPELANADNVARVVGIGALKYFDLSHNRRSDIVFSWDAALSFEGNTGPYLQYTHARLKSILRKAGDVKHSVFNILSRMDEQERRLAVGLLRLPEAMEDAMADWSPHVLAAYLHKLAQQANEFYHLHPVIQESDAEKRALRIALVSAAALTLAKGLSLLGIDAPDEM